MGFDFKTGSLLCRVSDATARWLVRRGTVVIAVAVALTAVLAPFALRVGMDDDVVKFLPEGDPDVVKFQEIGDRFHGLSIAILGMEAPDGDLFTAERLGAMRALTRELKHVKGVGFATGLTELRDVAEHASGEGEDLSVVADLVGELPASSSAAGAPEAMAALRQRVMSRDHIVGALISDDGTAALILAHLSPDARVTDTANAIRAAAARVLGDAGSDLRIRYGGAPFIGAYVAEGTQKDLRILAPYVVGAVLILVFLSFRSVIGMVLSVVSILLGIAWTMGLMGLAGRDFTLVSSSLPVLLIALGSAYSIHVLTRVLAVIDAGERDRREAVRRAVADVAPPVFAAGLTTALAFLSFLVMDISPMREFGLWMSVGTMAILYSGLLFVPAACLWLPLRARSEGRAPAWLMAAMIGAARRVSRDRRLAIVGLVVIGGASAAFLPNLTTHMDTKSLFSEGSEPMEAEHFLESRLGGSLFVQVEVAGDIRSALVLRQIDRLSDYAAALDGVADVQSVAQVVRLVSQALAGDKRIPADLDAARSLTVLADDDPNLRLLVDGDWKHALIQVKVGGFDTERAMRVARSIGSQAAVLGGVRVAVPRGGLGEAARLREVGDVASHVVDLLIAGGVHGRDPAAVAAALLPLGDAAAGAGLGGQVEERLRGHIEEDELLYLKDGETVAGLAGAVTPALAAGTLTEDALWALVEPRASDEDREDPEGLRKAVAFLHGDLKAVLRDGRQKSLESGLAPVLAGVEAPALREAVTRAAGVLLDDVAFLPAALADGPAVGRASLDVKVSGYPVLYAGMNRSVQMNQIWSTALSFLLVGLALWWAFRSHLLAFVALVPPGLTLLVAFGIIGAASLSIDIGTSMISAIAVGVGIDYAVHLLWKHGVPEEGQEDVALEGSLRATGWGIIINTLAVTVGFAVLLASTAVPMRRFGVLTAACMVVSAVATLLLIPALTRRVAPAVLRRWRTNHALDQALDARGALSDDGARVVDGDRRP